jgi:hypothetical protein
MEEAIERDLALTLDLKLLIIIRILKLESE